SRSSGDRSYTATSHPISFRAIAAANPPIPPPITTAFGINRLQYESYFHRLRFALRVWCQNTDRRSENRKIVLNPPPRTANNPSDGGRSPAFGTADTARP